MGRPKGSTNKKKDNQEVFPVTKNKKSVKQDVIVIPDFEEETIEDIVNNLSTEKNIKTIIPSIVEKAEIEENYQKTNDPEGKKRFKGILCYFCKKDVTDKYHFLAISLDGYPTTLPKNLYCGKGCTHRLVGNQIDNPVGDCLTEFKKEKKNVCNKT